MLRFKTSDLDFKKLKSEKHQSSKQKHHRPEQWKIIIGDATGFLNKK